MLRQSSLLLLAFTVVGCGSAASTGQPFDEDPLPDAAATTTRDAAPPPKTDASAPVVVDAGPPTPKASGSFHAITYNVAGLPEGLSASHPATNMPLISPKLNPFELVFTQEDFAYHGDLVGQATHASKTTHKSASLNLGDGVTMMSRFAFGPDTHVAWKDCNGYIDAKNDCLTPKGWVVATMTLTTGVQVDVYDLHADAGRDSGDAKARQKQMDQLVQYITQHSAGKALLVAGDTNMKDTDETQLTTLMTGANLTDACRKLKCPDPYRYDRILYRDGSGIVFTPTQWKVDMTFVDSNGKQLSDHEPVTVDFDWVQP